jgi:hypothetical protein
VVTPFLVVTPYSSVKSTDVAEEDIASIFRVEEKAKEVTNKNRRRVNPEDGRNKFLRNVEGLLPKYTAL